MHAILTVILFSFSTNPAPAIEIAQPEWAFIVPPDTKPEPSPPVDEFLAELDREFWGGIPSAFAADEHFVDPFDDPTLYLEEVREAQAALKLNDMQDQIDNLGR